MSKEERTGWRDMALSGRHRAWGEDVPAVDVDWVVVEYDRRVPVAIIDYKRGLNWIERASDHSNLAALAALADGYNKGIPFLIVRYDNDPWRFSLEPRNASARERIPKKGCGVVLSELRYVTFLYWLRDRPLPDIIRPELSTTETCP